MTAEHDRNRVLVDWFRSETVGVAPPETLARTLAATAAMRPRPAAVAWAGSAWVGASAATDAPGGLRRLRPGLAVALVTLLALALIGGAILVGGRPPAPAPLPTGHAYRDELVAAPDLPATVGRPLAVPLLDGGALVLGRDDGSGGDPAKAFVLDRDASAAIALEPPASAGVLGSAARLLDGRVLVIGDAGATLFDPTTRRFTAVGPMTAARSGASAVTLRDGRVLVAGGMPAGGTPGVDPALRSAELFDPATLSFAPTGSMASTSGGGPLVALPDGRAFLATDPAPEVWDPATGTFSAAGAEPGGRGIPVVLRDGRVAMFGSTGLFSGGSVTLWDPASGRFTTSSLAEPLTGAALLDDGRVLVIGMCRDGASGWTGLFDPGTGVMNPGPTTRACRPTSARLADGRVLVVGGDATDGPTAVPTVEVFQ